ncbi:MAG: copper chaperone PCu(A)C [Rhodospirillaceae bacterium]|nr:copper chaperone PCu(A)C [Rhodospirillaceae bacterium]
MRLLKILFVALVFATPAYAQSKSVVVEEAWVRIYEGATSAYFHIINKGEETDRLLEVSTPLADKAEVVSTRVRSGKFTYLPLKNLEIAGGGDERFRPGGVFVRLTGVKRALHVGDAVPLTLRFERSGHIEVSARVGNQLLGNR